ncbi:glycosyltransferase family 2 protein [Limoniibacter endophyticus]|uniref:Sugar transferase n=1 Tax=Limoniibacter endophyticus TaxID=1565040 RepID=A0A8J3DLX0_9HYPH|nr:glycosyltransferase family 2 protein [Limoniibacter endophyticus]GHC65655.1 sugar transferase [Limoniibacter endophyticus]
MPLLSLVVPFLNESEAAPHFAQFTTELEKIIKTRFGLDMETVFVDDGSRDTSIERFSMTMTGQWSIIELSRNFGKEMALFAGLEHAKGDYVLMIDADMQHPMSVCLAMIEEIITDDDLDVVYTIRDDRRAESLKKEVAGRAFYWLINFRQRFQMPENAGDFRIMRRNVVDALLTVRDRRRFNKGLYAWTGFRQKGLPYTPDARIGGATKWSKLSLLGLSLEGITSFSALPLRIVSAFGALTGLFGIFYGIKIIFEVFFYGTSVPGYPSLIVAITVLGGLNLALLGLLGEYVWVSIAESKNRPLYLIRKIHRSDNIDG